MICFIGKFEESQSILAPFDYSQDKVDIDCSQDVNLPSTLTNDEYMVYLNEGQSHLRSSDSTPDLYRSTATQTLVKTTNASTQYEQIDNPIKESAKILADSYFVGDETRKNKFIECYTNVVSSIIRLVDSEHK